MSEKIEHIFLDMDGVMVDWVGGVCDLIGPQARRRRVVWPPGEYDIETALGIHTDRLWGLVNRQGVEWWAHLEPLKTNLALWAMLSDTAATVSILTTPGPAEYVHSGKAQWIRNHAPHLLPGATMARDKHLLAGPGRLLIDDSDEKCQAFIEAGGSAIVFPQDWNSQSGWALEPLNHVKHELKTIGVIS